MTLDAAVSSALAAAPPDAQASDSGGRPVRSLRRQAIHDTLSNKRARAGLVWISIVAFAGVFAPFLANSYPFLIKIDGRISSPLLRHLSRLDIVLLIALAAAIIIFSRRHVRVSVKWAAFATIIAAAALGSRLFHAPGTNVYDTYRQLQRDGKIQWAVYAPVRFSPNDRMRDQPALRLTPPSRHHLMGTEANGADVLSRIIHASRIALAIGLIATSIAVVIGVVIGGLMGYFSGRVDIIGMRLIEVFEAIPSLFLLITFVAFYGRNLYLIMAIIGLVSWTGDARFIRAEFLRLRKQDFVQAAIAGGLPLRSILFRHMLPNGISPVLVSASFGVASAILSESVLSFLGLGLVDEPSWGQMLNQALNVGGAFTWWIAVFPGLAIFLTVFGYNLIGESMRDALDPRLHGIA